MSKYTIGLDFGTLSCRALLVRTADGEEIATSVFEYPHKVMDSVLPCCKKLGQNWALQHPQDYIDAIKFTVPDVIEKSKVSENDIIGIGVDFTSCTVLPITKDGTPLCFFEEYKEEPNAYVKLWKHHSAQKYAEKITEKAIERNEKWLDYYGGKISSEWAMPKIWQVLDEAPEIYDKTYKFVEAADWIVWLLTGNETNSLCSAGYKYFWNIKDGFPSKDFFKSLDLRLENVTDKTGSNILPLCKEAGKINVFGQKLTGLSKNTSVATGIIDAHVFLPAAKVCEEGKMLSIIGTSSCHMLLSKSCKTLKGISGVVADGILPGFYGYEAGQCCVGDHFQWFIENCLPKEYYEEAKKENISIHKYLRNKCENKKPGESGLIALDWWNGNRSVLDDSDLSGVIVGLTLQTKPEDIYRALIEATAFGTRKIIETYREYGLKVNSYIAAGGIAQKDPMTMQIYADIINMPVKIAESSQCGALGSAIHAAVAAGGDFGGYDSIYEASDKMGKISEKIFMPSPENVKIYDKLFREYEILHDYFGKAENDVMKRLSEIKNS